MNLPVQNTSPASGGLSSLKGARVLITDDNHVNRKIARSFLEKWDVTTDEAVNGMEALELFAVSEYDLLLIDLDMPVMNGYAMIEAIRKTNTGVVALVFSGSGAPEHLDELLKKGFSGMLSKPFQPAELHRQLTLAVAKQRPL